MASTRESLPDQLALAFSAVGDVIHRITTDQWAFPTPCTDWPVRRVVHHLVGMNRVFAALLTGEPLPARVDIADVDLVERYDSSAADLVAVFREPGMLERETAGPMGSASGKARLQIRLYDLIAHGWDVATATGQSLVLPDDLVEESLTFATAQLEGVDREGRFDAPQPCPESAEPVDRLAAFLGRDVGWRHDLP